MYLNSLEKMLIRFLVVLVAITVAFSGTGDARAVEVSLLVNTSEDELNSDGDCSLREAIQAANTNVVVDICPAGDGVDTDTITFSVSGTITLTSRLDILAGGPLAINGGGAITISGGDSVQILYINSGGTLVLDGLSLTNGKTTSDNGGAINNAGTLTISNSTLSGNNATGNSSKGGGVYNTGTLTLTNSTLSSNLAWGNNSYGGGIYNTGTLTITHSILSNNTIWYTSGGAISNSGQLTISDSTITGNSAHSAGGGISNSGTLSITNSTLSGNSVFYSGGAIYHQTGTLNITNSTLSGNHALGGGGISCSGNVFITNSTISGNGANNEGGGISNSGSLSLSNSTISENSAGDFGGGINGSGMGLTIRNTILAQNTAGDGGPDCNFMAGSSGGYNLFGSTTGCSISSATGDLRNVDPKLGPLQDNGGPTYTQELLPGSPAVEAGNPAGCNDQLGNPLGTDQRGVTRPIDGNGDGNAVCDIGAFEAQEPPPPDADAGGPYSGKEGSMIPLDASRSTDAYDSIVSYEWDLDDDGQFNDAVGITAQFTAVDDGVYPVHVRVTNVSGRSSEDSADVTVMNMPPVIRFLSMNRMVRVGVLLKGRVTFKDAGLNDTFTATWNWGDGTSTEGVVSGYTATGAHIYAKPGPYIVKVTITDKDGGTAQISYRVTVVSKKSRIW